MIELIIGGFLAGWVLAWTLLSRWSSHSKQRDMIKALRKRKEVEDEVENMSDSDRYDAGNKWL